MLAWTLFYNPMPLRNDITLLLLIVPLCAAIAIVYKTVRTNNLNRLWREIATLIVLMMLGLTGLGVGLFLVVKYWPNA